MLGCGACEVIANAVSQLSAATGAAAVTSSTSISEKDTMALGEARSVALELLLGAMSNLAPYRTEDVLQVRKPHSKHIPSGRTASSFILSLIHI